MSPLIAGVLGAILGMALTFLLLRLNRRPLAGAESPPRHLVPDPLRAAIEQLPGTAILVGQHDEILAQSMGAAASGLLRGSRMTQPAVLDLVREARSEAAPGVLNLDVPTTRGAPPRRLAARVAPLGDGVVLLVADDRSGALRIDATRRDFVANVTHELKTPVGAISLLAEALAEAADDPAAVRHFAGRMMTETARLAELISQIIALSRLQSSDPLLAAVPIDVNELVDTVLDQFREQADSRRITLSQQYTPALGMRGDRDQVAAALRNLVQNAIAYSEPGARVATTTRLVHDESGDWVELGVSDNGIGISEADRPRVFERFFRVDYGRSRDHGGTGLGLSIVRHIVSAHGGTVALWSRLGQGSTFTLRFPAHDPETDVEGRAE